MSYCFYYNSAWRTRRTPNVIPTREEKVGVTNTHATCKTEKPKRERERESERDRINRRKRERWKKCIDHIALAQSLFLSPSLSFFFVALDCCVFVHHYLRHLFLYFSVSLSFSLFRSLSLCCSLSLSRLRAFGYFSLSQKHR